MFHLKVHASVERILIFSKTDGELVGEMPYVATIEEPDETGQMQKVRVFNVNVNEEVVIALIVGFFGFTQVTGDKLFSRTLNLKNKEENEYINNYVLVNWSKPVIKETGQPNPLFHDPEICILDFPNSLTDILDVQPLILMQKFELPEGVDPEDAKKRGFDMSSGGYFVKEVRHKWPKDEPTMTILQNEKAKLSLYQTMILKLITPVPAPKKDNDEQAE